MYGDLCILHVFNDTFSKCWAIGLVKDNGPLLLQNWLHVSCLMVCQMTIMLRFNDFDFDRILQQPSIVEYQAGGGKEAGRSSRPADS